MLGPQAAAAALDAVLRASRADQTEAVLLAQDIHLTRLANNTIHQHVSETNATVWVRAVAGQRVGRAATNDLRPASLARAAEQALLHARQSPPIPDFPGLPEPQPLSSVHAFDDATASASATTRARAVATICALAAEHGLWAAGAFRTGASETAVSSSCGVRAYHPATVADIQTVVLGANGSGWAQASSWQIGELRPEAIGREAVGKARRAQNPRALPPGEYTIVVDPYVTDELLTTLSLVGMGAQELEQGSSWMHTRLGQQALSPLISIWDDGLDRHGAPLPFDGEGLPRQRVSLVERGVVRGPVYDHATARRAGRASTGHARPPGTGSGGPVARNLLMAPGDATLEQLIGSTERGLYITRFWYPQLVHPRDCVIAATTRDGVTLIERGELTHPVRNLRFTQSYVEALANVTAVGAELRTLIDDHDGATRVPALKIARFSFSGAAGEQAAE